MWWDWLLAVAGVATTVYLIAGGDDFFDRSIVPNDWDIVFGVALMLLILEAMRRTTGWIMPFVTTCFLAYAFFGEILPAPWTHKDYEIPRLVGHMYMTLEGIYGIAISVSSTLIILFTIYGAFLQFSGRRQVLHRLLVRGDGRQADQRRAHGDAGVVPARRAVGLRASRPR